MTYEREAEKMKTLNKTAEKTFRALIADLAAPGDAKKIENSGGAFMAVSVDFLSRNADGSCLYAVAHRFEQNGDLCPDPDVEFYVTPLGVAPTAIDQIMGYQRAVEFDERGVVSRIRLGAQADITSFCNGWLRNIREQQGIA
jgi:hypothetical protein